MRKLELNENDFSDRLLPGITISEFVDQYFRRRTFHARSGNSEYFSHVFTKRDLAAIFENHLLHRPSVRMIGEGRVLPMQEISMDIPFGKFAFENVVDLRKVQEWYSRGYTINVRGAHFFHNGLKRCAVILREIFGCNIRANIYLTPESESGLMPHYDVNDVLIVQIHGKKRWSFYQNNFETPTEEFRFGNNDFEVGEVDSSAVLEPGDVLYLPRGVSHSATAMSESLHVTLGIEEPTVSDIAKELIGIVSRTAAFREVVDCREILTDTTHRRHVAGIIGDAVLTALADHNFDAAVSQAQEKNLKRSVSRDSSFLREV